MLAGSFRLVTARLIPRAHRCKQVLLLAVVILSACGGSGAPKVQSSWKALSGSGFRFEAPSGWRTQSAGKIARAAHDGELVQVTTFPLVKPYNDALFAKVQREL